MDVVVVIVTIVVVVVVVFVMDSVPHQLKILVTEMCETLDTERRAAWLRLEQRAMSGRDADSNFHELP